MAVSPHGCNAINRKLKTLLFKAEHVTQTFIVGIISRKWIFTRCLSLRKSFARMTANFFFFTSSHKRGANKTATGMYSDCGASLNRENATLWEVTQSH